MYSQKTTKFPNSVRADELWKNIIEDYVEDFVRLFFPKLSKRINFDIPLEFLDKELQQIALPGNAKTRYVDKLIKASLKNGATQWVLIHVEVQGKQQAHFSKRMFIYYYRLFDRYQKDVTALALLTYSAKTYKNTFEHSFFGTSVHFKYNQYVLKHLPEKELPKDNIFTYVLTHAYNNIFLKTKEEKLKTNLDNFRKMIKNGYTFEQFRNLKTFYLGYLNLKSKNILSIFEDKEITTIMEKVEKIGKTTQYILDLAQKEWLADGKIPIVFKDAIDAKAIEVAEEKVKLMAENQLKLLIKKAYEKGTSMDLICQLFEVEEEYVKGLIKV